MYMFVLIPLYILLNTPPSLFLLGNLFYISHVKELLCHLGTTICVCVFLFLYFCIFVYSVGIYCKLIPKIIESTRAQTLFSAQYRKKFEILLG